MKTKPKTAECTFCDFSNLPNEIIEESNLFWVVENLFKYDFWDSCGVEEHLMIVPKRHVIGISEFNKKEQDEYFKVVSKYENHGYSLYARAPSDITKSVLHQHSHFIKLDRKPKRFVVYAGKPHINIYK